MLKIKVLSFSFLAIILIFSCKSDSKNDNDGIPLESLDEKLVYKCSLMAEDITSSFNDDKGAEYITEYNYVTPILSAGINRYETMYKEAYLMINLVLGEINSPVLMKAEHKPHGIKSMQYKLTSPKEDIDSVTLMLDINVDNNLAKYYLMVTSKDGTLNNQNVLPEVSIKF